MILGTRDYELSPSVIPRANVEGKIARRLVLDLIAAGFEISVHNGEAVEVKRSKSVRKITKAMWSTDEDYLFVYKAGAKERFGWVKFVYGNDGWDVINDYTTNLEPWMEGANKVSEAHS